MGNSSENSVIRNIDKLPNATKMAVVLCASAYSLGINWGFLRDSDSQAVALLSNLGDDTQNIRLTRVNNGYIVECREQLLENVVAQVDANNANSNFEMLKKDRKSNETSKLLKFIKDIIASKNRFVVEKAGYLEFTIGLYCTNQTNFIRINGKDIPSYKLTLSEALNVIRVLNENGLKVYSYVDLRNETSKTFEPVADLLRNRQVGDIFNGMEISNTDTGVFLTLRCIQN